MTTAGNGEVLRASDSHFLKACQVLTAVVFGAAALYYVIVSLHWRIMVDSSVMHYVIFLMRHGRAPYTEISDNNMPGAYFVEGLGMRLFGLSDLGWRLFEFTVLGVLTVALADIARRWDRFAGLFAAGLFVVIHSAEGAQYAAERELVLATLLVVALGLLFRAVEADRPWLLLLFGLATGLAASIKPTCLPLAVSVLLLAVWVSSRQGRAVMPLLLYGFAGMGAVFAADLLFLLHFHALPAFRFILQHVIPAYVGMGLSIPYTTLLSLCVPRLLFPVVLMWPVLLVLNHRRYGGWDWQRWALLLGAAFGLFSFVAQHKGYLHHRYTFELFVFLLTGIELFRALRLPGAPRWLATATLVFVLVYAVPHTLRQTAKVVGHSDLELAMQNDLQQLGGADQLQNKVQCFDLVFGCLDALYHLRIVENASFTGDLLFFSRRPTEATEYYRQRFWAGVAKLPPEVVVLTNQNLSDLNDFDKVQRWPEFSAWLSGNYEPAVERHFLYEHFGGRFDLPVPPAEQDAYRIYVRKGSALQAQGRTLAAEPATGQF